MVARGRSERFDLQNEKAGVGPAFSCLRGTALYA
jgi:hypothetical protein